MHRRFHKYISKLREILKHIISTVVYSCLLTGLPSSRREVSHSADVAVVCLASLGDFITFCAVARELHRNGRQLILICRQGTQIEEFAAMTDYFEQVLPLRHRFMDRWGNLQRLRQLTAKIVLVAPVERHILSDLYALAIRSNQRVLPDTMQGCSIPALKNRVDKRVSLIPVSAINEQERYEQYLRGISLCEVSLEPFVFDWVDLQPRTHQPCIAVFPGAGGGSAKQWPVERFSMVADTLAQRLGCKVLVCGTAQEHALGEQLCAQLAAETENLCGRTDLSELLERLRCISLVLANDSGSAHLAIACGVPTVIIGGGWEYGRFYPNPHLPKFCRAMVVPPDSNVCIPCRESRPTCVRDEAAPCILAVEVEDVLKVALNCLGI